MPMFSSTIDCCIMLLASYLNTYINPSCPNSNVSYLMTRYHYRVYDSPLRLIYSRNIFRCVWEYQICMPICIRLR
ncbi:hypothetical protein HBI67_077290 [Parastagonospora nodorum]|nr:hypothetical protein HBI66_124460 [Parastagonospora nodorum]KAH6071500.1 hypothetical protein HBI67_077290 [Parastagonospora nodorum]